jgi:hypothetical protein
VHRTRNTITSGNTNAPATATGERVADFVTQGVTATV